MEIKEGMLEYTFKNRLKDARNNKGLTQVELAQLSGCHQSKVSDYENLSKATMPELFNAVNIARELGVSLDWLCGISNDERKISSVQWLIYLDELLRRPPMLKSKNDVDWPAIRLRVNDKSDWTGRDCVEIVFSGRHMRKFFEAYTAVRNIKGTIGGEKYKDFIFSIFSDFESLFTPQGNDEEEKAQLMSATPRPG